MKSIQDYIASQMLGKTYHFSCDCIVALDVVGTIQDYEIKGQEIIFIVNTNPKIIRIGSNHPGLMIEELR